MILELIKKALLVVQTPASYRLDYWTSIKNNNQLELKPIPWMNYKAISYVENYLSPGALVFEYGSGSSTRYWIQMGCKVISIEHDREFFEKMYRTLAEKCDYRLVEPEIDAKIGFKSHESPDSYKSADSESQNFESYVKMIDMYQDDYFDLVVVDGRARPACIKHAVSKIKRGGILVLDNSDRDYYLKNTLSLLEGWPRKTFKGTVRGLMHKEQTTVFRKP